MAASVKREPTRRQQKAQATRRRVLDAALELFLADGYTTTTIAAIADAADVAVQTVYAVFGNKRAILDELRGQAVVGDEAVALRDTNEWQKMERERDPQTQLRMLAAVSARIGRAIGPLYTVMSGAASSDPEIAELFRDQQQARWDDQHRVARILARRHHLNPDLTAKEATDIMWTIASPQTHHNLVTQRGWNDTRYERWLGDTLVACLLQPS